MATVKRTGSGGQIQLIKPYCLVATLYNDGDTNDEPTGDTLIFDEVVRDTTTISQEDNDSTEIENEFSDDPILEIVSLGKFTLESEVADVQRDILVKMADYTYDETAKKIYAPSSYEKKYAKIDLVFPNGTDADGNDTYMSLCVPKLQLNSQMQCESLNSNLVRLKLAGTAKSVLLSINGKSKKSAAYINESYTIPAETETSTTK